ncbi:hypothetical protein M5K25_025158 [Dendrobium thyrsiflorum]|uniref:Uncharacterized protein n=1 Tax=Dendrobium thyrsiflorum TaxID=117978 RepID=A0ABD0U3R0_DENTH
MRRSHRTCRALAGRGITGRGIVMGTGRRVQGEGAELEAQGAGTGTGRRVRYDAQGAEARHKGCLEIDCMGRSATGEDLSGGGAVLCGRQLSYCFSPHFSKKGDPREKKKKRREEGKEGRNSSSTTAGFRSDAGILSEFQITPEFCPTSKKG